MGEKRNSWMPFVATLGGVAIALAAAACSDGAMDSVDPDDPDNPTPTEPDWAPDGYCSDSGIEWAFCEDFDGQGADDRGAYPASGSRLEFRTQSHITIRTVSCETSGDCSPYTLNGAAFTNSEDSGFGMAVTRITQPFDFADREGHIHFETVLKGHPRMVTSMHLSPRPANSMPDVRDPSIGAMDHAKALTVHYQGDGGWPFTLLQWDNGQNTRVSHGDGPLGIDLDGLHAFDIYISRTSVRLELDGVERFHDTFDDLGFDHAYVHLALTSYNPVKDGYAGVEANTFQWDNIAFDGTAYAPNSLTPVGSQDIVFRAFSTSACTVRGVEADGPSRENWGTWHTWHARLADEGGPITAADISCNEVPESPYIEDPHVADVVSIRQ